MMLFPRNPRFLELRYSKTNISFVFSKIFLLAIPFPISWGSLLYPTLLFKKKNKHSLTVTISVSKSMDHIKLKCTHQSKCEVRQTSHSSENDLLYAVLPFSYHYIHYSELLSNIISYQIKECVQTVTLSRNTGLVSHNPHSPGCNQFNLFLNVFLIQAFTMDHLSCVLVFHHSILE